MEISILGLGARGRMFANIALAEGHQIVAVCDTNEERRKDANTDLKVSKSACFENAEEFFKAGKLSEVLVLSTLDSTHYEYAIKALKLGYNILLEKPIALKFEEIVEIGETAKSLNRKVGVCHVLRYTPFYQKIKELIDSGIIGRVMNVNQTENVGYYHYAHSFVRGNWHNSKETCPMILAKCCHDFDLILWLTGKSCKKLSSFGGLDYFTSENAPKESAERCKYCKEKVCPFNAYDIYTKYPTWVKQPNGYDYTVENAVKVLNDNSTFYDKCVFHTDNDVVDHQIVNMELEDGIIANLTMQAFSGEIYRRTQVCGTKGEIFGVFEENKIVISLFGKEKQEITVTVNDTLSQHLGGDRKLFVDFMKFVEDESYENFKTQIDKSVESHILALKAEESRLNDGEVIVLK